MFSDEMYQGLERETCLELPSASTLSPAHVTLSGLSKWGALPGLRIGWLVTQDTELTQRFNCLKDYVSICPPAPSEFLAEVALKHRQRILGRSRQLCSDGLAAVRALCAANSDWLQWIEPLGSSVCFPRLRSPKMSAADWCEQLANTSETRLMVLPSPLFDMNDSHFRIGYGRANVPDLLLRLESHIEKYGPPATIH